MRFEVVERVPHGREEVFRTLRDDLVSLVPHLPNVDRIDVVERTPEAAGRVRIVNRWHGRGSVPLVARPFIPARYLSWIDDARWETGSWSCRWRFVTALPEVLSCEGFNTFVSLPTGGTELRLSGDLRVDLSRMRGLPRLFRGASGRLTAFLVARVRPNLANLVRALDLHLGAGPGLHSVGARALRER